VRVAAHLTPAEAGRLDKARGARTRGRALVELAGLCVSPYPIGSSVAIDMAGYARPLRGTVVRREQDAWGWFYQLNIPEYTALVQADHELLTPWADEPSTKETT
jgi:hypothetical protein